MNNVFDFGIKFSIANIFPTSDHSLPPQKEKLRERSDQQALSALVAALHVRNEIEGPAADPLLLFVEVRLGTECEKVKHI